MEDAAPSARPAELSSRYAEPSSFRKQGGHVTSVFIGCEKAAAASCWYSNRRAFIFNDEQDHFKPALSPSSGPRLSAHAAVHLRPRRLGLDWIEQGLTSPPTQYRLSGRQFYR